MRHDSKRFSLIVVALTACGPSGRAAIADGGVEAETDSGFAGDPCKSSVAAGAFANVSVGHGQSFFEPLSGAETLTWEKGPQGGHHVWVALRMIGLRKHGTVVEIDLDDVEEPRSVRAVGSSRVIYDFDRDEGGHCILVGQRSQLDNSGGVTIASLVGHHLRIRAILSDPDGATAVDMKTVVVTGASD
jgi:hypothetical protein